MYTRRERIIKTIKLTDETLVSWHAYPFLPRTDVVGHIHFLVCPELATGRKGRYLQHDSLCCVIFFTVLGVPALLLSLLLALGVDDLDRKGVFNRMALGLSLVPPGRGYHGCGVLRLGAPCLLAG